MSTIGVRAAKAMGVTLSHVVKNVNASGVIKMKPNGALTKASRDIYQAELKKEGVKSVEALIGVSKKKLAEATAKLKEALANTKKTGFIRY